MHKVRGVFLCKKANGRLIFNEASFIGKRSPHPPILRFGPPSPPGKAKSLADPLSFVFQNEKAK